jgi:ABC-type transport system involved in multi-copper enzyme maturation permease subunit
VINLKNIWSVALYERKTLFRSWFFRIFAILILLILFGLNMGLFAGTGARWTTRAIAANIPYINVLFVNVAQAVIAVFLASDFMQRDRKLDTTEVIYARPISNGEYVTGKTLGIMVLFIGLVFTVLLMALTVNLVITDTPVVWQAYLLYPLLISVPTLFFILGLSFFLMILFRSQAVTFIVLLGYIGLTLFYFKDKMFGTFDYMAFHLPMVHSDFISFADLHAILLQRTAYLLLGFGFIFATIRFMRRLPQTGKWNLLNLFAFIIFIAAGTFTAYTYYAGFHQQDEARKHYLWLNNKFADHPVADVITNNLTVEQKGKGLVGSSEMIVSNPGTTPLDTLLFSLNPAFSIDSITVRGAKTEYLRNAHLIRIVPEEPLDEGRRTSLRIFYRGIPDEAIAYLDISKSNRASLKRINVATIDKKPAIIDEDFLLLTRELLWYPVAGVGFNTKTFQPALPDFTRFSLSVKAERGLTAVAPGKAEEVEGRQHFSPETDLNSFPLVIGPFEKRTLQVDDVEYNLFVKPDHDYFSSYFGNIGDTLGALIKEAQEDYEYDELDLYYAFKRLNIVEVPVQYHPYERPFSQVIENVQPEMIFLPEKGTGINTLDFKRFKNAEERRNRERDNARTAEEIEIDLFKNFLRNTFFSAEINSGGGFRGRGEDLITFEGELQYTKNPWCVFPLYYSYVNSIHSMEYPLFNAMVETYLKEGYEVQPRQSFMGGISDSERANLALKDRSLTEILTRQNEKLSAAAINQSGSFVLLALKNRVGSAEFDNFLYYYLEDHPFSVITFEDFAADFENDFGVEMAPYLEFIKTGNQLPEFLVSSPEFIISRDDYGDVYVVRMTISNTGMSDGLVDFTFRMPPQGGFGGGGGGGGMDTEQRLFEVPSGKTKEVQLVFYSQPRMLTVNTLISGNIPASFSLFLRSAEEKMVTDTEEYERISDYSPDRFVDGEVIVDNEDEGFSYVSVSNESKVKKFIDSRKEPSERINYRGMSPGWQPATWSPVAHSSFYGRTIRSAMLSGKGDGSSVARWTAMMPGAGFYDLYAYIPVSAMLGRPTGRGQGGDGPERGSGRGFRGPQFADNGAVYLYTVSSKMGREEVSFTLQDPEDGWNRLGTFHFPADTATVELSNNTTGKRVVADAVKWVRRD